MYHQHFGLSGPPFQFTPAPNALYLGKTHREALAALEWGLLHEPSGFTLLLGESGVGKTTLVCSLLAHRYQSVRAAFLTNPRLNFEQLLQVALSQLAPKTHGRGKLELIEALLRLLEDLAPGERVALILDESQNLSDETLEELRLLSNFDHGAEHRLQLIFVGQPELMQRLRSERMRSLNERIGARTLLKPLSPAEAREYVDCRLRARSGTSRRIFASDALKYLLAHSRGIPRRINVLCHNAMLQAYAAGSKKVTLALARNAANEYEDLLGSGYTEAAGAAPAQAVAVRWRWAALAASVLALCAVGAAHLWPGQIRSESSSTHPGIAIRSVAGSKTTGPMTLLRPVASTANGTSVAATDPKAPSHSDPSSVQAAPRTAAKVADAHSSAVDPGPARGPDWAAIAHGAATDPAPRSAAAAAAADGARTAASVHGATAAAAATHSVRVRAGDSLWTIAIRDLGSSAEFSKLLSLNPQLQNADEIFPGETVYLPAAKATAAR